MKVIFSFTDEPDITSLPKARIYTSSLQFPDAALQLPDCREKVIELATFVGQASQALLHITCEPMDLKNFPVKTTTDIQPYDLDQNIVVMEVGFNQPAYRGKTQKLKIMKPLWDRKYSAELHRLLRAINETGLVLLNCDSFPAGKSQRWYGSRFELNKQDKALINRFNRRVKKEVDEHRKRQREEEKRLKREEKIQAQQSTGIPASIPVTGAGRRPGAIPGVFKGIQFRSQLEIRFVTELESRQVRWVYEAERLGNGNYLVDFYLPDFKCWVEVKGKFEPRDDYLLKDVADYLKRERGERLFVFTQSKGFKVNSSGFREMKRDKFWDEVLQVPS